MQPGSMVHMRRHFFNCPLSYLQKHAKTHSRPMTPTGVKLQLIYCELETSMTATALPLFIASIYKVIKKVIEIS